MGFNGVFVVDQDGRRGGITMIWWNSFVYIVIDYLLNFICGKVVKDDIVK